MTVSSTALLMCRCRVFLHLSVFFCFVFFSVLFLFFSFIAEVPLRLSLQSAPKTDFHSPAGRSSEADDRPPKNETKINKATTSKSGDRPCTSSFPTSRTPTPASCRLLTPASRTPTRASSLLRLVSSLLRVVLSLLHLILSFLRPLLRLVADISLQRFLRVLLLLRLVII